MDGEKQACDVEMSKDEVADVIKDINRFYSEVTVTKVSGACPYGHKEGEVCGALTFTTRLFSA